MIMMIMVEPESFVLNKPRLEIDYRHFDAVSKISDPSYSADVFSFHLSTTSLPASNLVSASATLHLITPT